MTARDGMTNLIATLRAWTEAGTADYTLAGATYWTDDLVQDTLDRHRTDIHREPLTVEAEYSDGDLVYHNYYAPMRYYEEAAGGEDVWRIEDAAGSAIGTADYTVNYHAGHIRFTADTAGSARYLVARAYDMHRAAADVWRRKAAHVAGRVDWSTDNHTMKASQMRVHYLEMATYYEGQAVPRMVRLERSDVND
jgi:hypothetical protein